VQAPPLRAGRQRLRPPAAPFSRSGFARGAAASAFCWFGIANDRRYVWTSSSLSSRRREPRKGATR